MTIFQLSRLMVAVPIVLNIATALNISGPAGSRATWGATIMENISLAISFMKTAVERQYRWWPPGKGILRKYDTTSGCRAAWTVSCKSLVSTSDGIDRFHPSVDSQKPRPYASVLLPSQCSRGDARSLSRTRCRPWCVSYKNNPLTNLKRPLSRCRRVCSACSGDE